MRYLVRALAPECEVFESEHTWDTITDDEYHLTLMAAGVLYHAGLVGVWHALYEGPDNKFVLAYDPAGMVVSQSLFDQTTDEYLNTTFKENDNA